ncbi:hypothetical protein LX36DRAFT_673134 [Colletotrichum falcatum]|nr:hypothetical protein LX36DRAFT_673134 [Colletotrichum falcatum]
MPPYIADVSLFFLFFFLSLVVPGDVGVPPKSRHSETANASQRCYRQSVDRRVPLLGAELPPFEALVLGTMRRGHGGGGGGGGGGGIFHFPGESRRLQGSQLVAAQAGDRYRSSFPGCLALCRPEVRIVQTHRHSVQPNAGASAHNLDTPAMACRKKAQPLALVPAPENPTCSDAMDT